MKIMPTIPCFSENFNALALGKRPKGLDKELSGLYNMFRCAEGVLHIHGLRYT
jgi:hypothetical protein